MKEKWHRNDHSIRISLIILSFQIFYKYANYFNDMHIIQLYDSHINLCKDIVENFNCSKASIKEYSTTFTPI